MRFRPFCVDRWCIKSKFIDQFQVWISELCKVGRGKIFPNWICEESWIGNRQCLQRWKFFRVQFCDPLYKGKLRPARFETAVLVETPPVFWKAHWLWRYPCVFSHLILANITGLESEAWSMNLCSPVLQIRGKVWAPRLAVMWGNGWRRNSVPLSCLPSTRNGSFWDRRFADHAGLCL